MENNELVLVKLKELFLSVCSLKINSKTKVPSVNMKKEEALELLGKINDIANLHGMQFTMETVDGELFVKMEEI